MKILAAGINVRHIACSAARAGHCVIAADCYCDLDLSCCSSQTVLLSEESILAGVNYCINRFSPDAVVLGPGLEEAKISGIRLLNNPPDLTARVSDKLWLARWLEKKGYPGIPTYRCEKDVAFPAVVKPRRGAGGVGCRLVLEEEDLRLEEGMIAQDLMAGRPASVSVIGTGGEASAISENEQLIGLSWTGAEGFRYCGNITPLEPGCPSISRMAEDLVADLGLVGSNGVDFLLTDQGPVVVEVNPRFQGSLDPVELSTGLNVFEAHLQAFTGILPKRPVPRTVAGRAIIYAASDQFIAEDLSGEGRTDIPQPGSWIQKGGPILSELATGRDRNQVFNELKDRASRLCEKLRSWR